MDSTDRLLKKFKKGQQVKIKRDISITKERHTAGHKMKRMASSDETFKIERIGLRGVYINKYIWAPEDIILLDTFDDSPVIVNREIALFDPNELV